MVPLGFSGKIHVNNSLLPQSFPPEFFLSLTVLRKTLSRHLEAGVRPIIALFLAYAVEAARQKFNKERLSVQSEVPFPTVQIPEVGLVGGNLDFLTADAQGFAPMGTLHIFPMSYLARRLDDGK